MRTEILGLGWALALGFMGGLGRAQEPVPPPASHASTKPCDTCIPGVENAAQVSEALWRGAQPTAEGFRALAQRGVKTVVSFRHDHDDLPLLKGTGLKYLRIPSRAFRPTDANVVAFLKVMADPANGPVFIHCAQGRDRTGYNAAAYRRVMQGWTGAEALKEMHAFRFNKVWVGNPGFVKRMDVEGLRVKVQTAPAPVFQQSE
jgi:protein tyrosine phosphatase (PTP) superfamily phosphohydrolase (DUF442 family)